VGHFAAFGFLTATPVSHKLAMMSRIPSLALPIAGLNQRSAPCRRRA
jgi:hypothetical protein